MSALLIKVGLESAETNVTKTLTGITVWHSSTLIGACILIVQGIFNEEKMSVCYMECGFDSHETGYADEHSSHIGVLCIQT